MKALLAAEMREVDRLSTERAGIPELQLMESAGREAALAALRALAGRGGARAAILCGKGNNGGDGLVAARYLQDSGLPTRVFLFGRAADLRGGAAANLARWTGAGNPVETVAEMADWERHWPEVRGATALLDALLGTGLRGAPSGVVARAIADINAFSRHATAPRPVLILAIDTPSGLPSDGEPAPGPLLFAHRTLSFTAPKIGQLVSRDAQACGALEVADIGSPAALVEEAGKGSLRWIEPTEFRALPLVRPANSHKGKYGHVLLVAGSAGKSGAAVLAGLGALRAGAGLVTLAAPGGVQAAIAAAHPEYMTEVLETTADGAIAANNLDSGNFTRMARGKTVLAAGPGLGTASETREFVVRLVRETALPVILDADGLNAFAGRAGQLADRVSPFLAVTPHPGEMARLLDGTTADVEADRPRAALESAKRWNAYVILKGFHTLVAAPDGQLLVNTSGNPGLAKGGSGDVLTGILAALTAQFGTADWTRVLALGTYLHGLAAETLAVPGRDVSGMLASEVAGAVPAARDRLIRELEAGA